MGYLTPSYEGELDYDVSAGAVTLTWTACNENDIILLCVEGQGGDTFTTPSGYALMAIRQTGSGATHTRGAIYGRRSDGTETGVTVADTGDHTSVSAHCFRGIERTTAIVDFPSATFDDATADTEQRTLTVNGTSAGVASGQQFHVMAFTTGGDNHGGSTNSVSTGSNWLAASNDIRSAGHTVGSDGSHWTRQARGDSTSTDRQWIMGTVNSMTEARLAVYLPAHQFTENTRSVSDSLTSADAIDKDVDFTRALADALGLSEALARTGAFTRSVADSLDLAEAVSRVQGWVRGVADSLDLADAVTTIQGWVRGVADSLTLADTVAQLKTLSRFVTDSLGLSDVATRVRGVYRDVTDSLNLSDTVKYLKWGVKAVVTALLTPLTEVVTSVKPLTAITSTINRLRADTSVTVSVRPLTNVDDSVEPLTDIEDDISG